MAHLKFFVRPHLHDRRVFFSSLLGSLLFQVQYVVALTIVRRTAKMLWRRERPYAPDAYFVDYPE